jgi:hypothetical protein
MGKKIEVAAKTDVKDKEGKVLKTVNGVCSYDFGDNLAEATKMFGEQVVYTTFVAQAIINLQAAMRRTLIAGGDCAALASTWKPGVSAPRVAVDPIAAAKNKFAQMNPAERAKFLADLKAMG